MNVFMARQPVFNRHLEATAYELLFRDYSLGAFLNSAKAAAGDATPPAFSPISIDRLANNKRAFVFYTPELLLADIALHLPRNLIGVELPEEVIAGSEALATARRLKELGYLLVTGPSALDSKELCLLVDVLKVNFIDLTRRPEILKNIQNTKIKLWASEIGDIIDFDRAIALGYTYFQGSFVIKPHKAPSRDLNVSRSKYLRIFSELTKSEIDFKSLESLIQQDVAFCYKLLKFVNSAAFGFRETIRSIRQALVLLGQEEVLHWVASLTLREVANNKPLELVTLSVARAKFGELLANEAGLKERAPRSIHDRNIFFIGRPDGSPFKRNFERIAACR